MDLQEKYELTKRKEWKIRLPDGSLIILGGITLSQARTRAQEVANESKEIVVLMDFSVRGGCYIDEFKPKLSLAMKGGCNG